MTALGRKPRIDVVRINFYGQHELENERWISRVLDSAGTVAHVVPVRFSSDYGLHWKPFAADGPRRAAFDEACLSSQVEWQGSDVGFGGNIAALSATQTGVEHPTPFNHVTVSIEANHPPVQSVSGLRPLVSSMIEATGAVYAYGSWQRGVLHNKQRNLLWDKKSDHAEPRPLMAPRWLGLPADHVYLEWFGPAYAELVAESLTGLAMPFEGGLLAEYGWDDQERARRIPGNLIAHDQPAAAVPPGW